MITETLKPSNAFIPATRINRSLTAKPEKRLLECMAHRLPARISSDHLTALGFGAQLGAGLLYAFTRVHRACLWGVIVCLVLNWFGDSSDGTVARVRGKTRPRFGFYVDHIVDVLGATAMMCGLGASGIVHWQVALAMLVAFLLLACESYLATYTLSRFALSPGLFGPTELRILLVLGNLAVLRQPYATVAGHRVLLFDLGGVIGAAGMLLLLLACTVQHTAELYRQEPLGEPAPGVAFRLKSSQTGSVSG